MKHILYVCLTISLIFAGCKKEDDPHTAPFVKIYGCTDYHAENYNPDANVFIPNKCCYTVGCNIGCTDPTAINYSSTAIIDDGSCQYATVYGCTDPTAINYNSAATVDDGSCVYTGTWDCFEGIGCVDPGTGNGQYSSLSACESNCSSSSPFSGYWTGSFDGHDYGIWSATISSNGDISGSSSSMYTGDTQALIGTVDNTGSFYATAGTGSLGTTFIGQFSGDYGAGTWAHSDGYSGTWEGTKQ